MAKEKFEDQMQRLELIVKTLEGNEVGLDEAIKLYEEGLLIAQKLSEQLKTFENKIASLEGQKDQKDEL